MNPRKRLYQAICGGIPDRVPVVPKIWVDLAAKLTGTPLSDVIGDPLTALRVIALAGRECRVDAIRQFHFPRRRVSVVNERMLEIGPDGTPVGEIDVAGGLGTHLAGGAGFDITDPHCMAYHHYWSADTPFIQDLDDAKKTAVPDKEFYVDTGCGERQQAVIAEFGDEMSIIGDCSSATMAFLVCMRGMNRAVMDLIDEPMLVHAIMEKGAAIAIEKGKFNIDIGIDVLRLNDSVGNMNVISPSHWREYVMPHMRDVCCALHAYNPGVRIYCHICGNILPIVEDLVRTGIDCIGPLDPMGGFTPKDVRDRVGDSVSLMGGVDTLSFLNGTPEQVFREASACIMQAAANGGYILGSGCVVPRMSPLQNLIALRESAERHGVYNELGKLANASE